MKVLFLDDSENRRGYFKKRFPTAEWVRTAEDAIESLRAHQYKEVWLDFDLHRYRPGMSKNETGNGMDVVHWIERNPEEVSKETQFVVHSTHAIKGDKMYKHLKKIGFPTRRIEFGSLMYMAP